MPRDMAERKQPIDVGLERQKISVSALESFVIRALRMDDRRRERST
ncbi:MAG: hypothetical protein WBO09_01985 [Methylocystis silviterrae]